MPRILIADDDPQIRRLLRVLLPPDGHEVVEAADGAEAPCALPESGFDLMLCDLLMPNKEGLETIREAKRAFPALRIVAMSGGVRGGGDILKVARLLGADGILAKPFSRQDLFDVLAAALGEDASAAVAS